MDLFILFFKITSVIYAIFFLHDLSSDQQWVFGWGKLAESIDSFGEWVKKYWILYIPFMIVMFPIMWLYALHPIILCYWIFNL